MVPASNMLCLAGLLAAGFLGTDDFQGLGKEIQWGLINLKKKNMKTRYNSLQNRFLLSKIPNRLAI